MYHIYSHFVKRNYLKGYFLVSFNRLFEQFVPKNYKLYLDLDKEKLKFSGTVTITGSTPKPSTTVKLQSHNLKIKSAKINGQKCTYEHGENDELILTTEKPVHESIEIVIEFSGKVTKPMHGLYPCYAKNGDVLLATQFESHHAREVFPCIDEPEAKATFDLTLKTNQKEIVLSNMPVASQNKDGDRLVTTFEQSPIMSTYLLAFVTGKMQAVSGKTKDGTEVNVWSSKDHKPEHLEFALQTAIQVTEFFNGYFKTAYPLPKCDHVALPDFSSGAMENWGLITYREVCLLVDPKKTSTATKEYAGTVIAHELSHQWFGNLVTMKWWDDLWLNESFATLMEYLAIDNIHPEWDVMLSFASHEALSASRRDMLPGVQAVATAVDHPDQISTLFDPSIVYAKGARLLLMAYNIVGEKAFRNGLRQYFKDHAYKNTVGKDLWQAFSDASGIDVPKIMEAWVKQPGFPLLSVEEDAGKITLEQSKFNSKDSTDLWPIPLFASKDIGTEILTKQKATIKTNDNNVLFNTLGGHYSVHYKNKAQLNYLKQQIIEGKLSPSQKLLLLNDLSLQAKVGVGSIVDILSLLDAFENETSEPVWGSVSMVLAEAKRIIEGNEEAEASLKEITAKLITKQFERLGWDNKPGESSNDTKLREIILGLATYCENPSVIKEAKARFKKNTLANLPADTRGIVMSASVKFGDEALFEKMLNQYPLQTNSELQQDIASALTSTKDPKLAKQLLAKLKDDTWVRLQDVDRFVVYLLQNRHSRKHTWAWLKNNWGWIEKNFASDKSYDNYPRYTASAFATDEWLKEYKAFYNPKKNIPALTRNIALGEAEIKQKASWTKRDQKKLATWLSKN